MTNYDQLLQQLPSNSARGRSAVNGRFTRLLEGQINIGKGIRGRASTSQTHLREFLTGEHGRDNAFPRILQSADSDFIGGSFDRHVKIMPLDDIDLYFPIDGSSLIYSEQSGPSRFHVRSDVSGSPNPLYHDWQRWIKVDGTISSRKLLEGFRSALERHYPNQTKIAIDGQAINTQFSIDATKESDGLGFDVVPCFSLFDSTSCEPDIYVIPDGNDNWICTNPKLDRDLSKHLHLANNGCYRPAVKLIKYWNRIKLSSKLSSYYSELAISRAFDTGNASGISFDRISEAVAFAFYAVAQAIGTGDQVPLIRQAPPVEPGALTNDDIAKINEAAQWSKAAWQFESQGDEDKAITCWEAIFDGKF